MNVDCLIENLDMLTIGFTPSRKQLNSNIEKLTSGLSTLRIKRKPNVSVNDLANEIGALTLKQRRSKPNAKIVLNNATGFLNALNKLKLNDTKPQSLPKNNVEMSNLQRQTRANNINATQSLTNSLKSIHLSNPQQQTMPNNGKAAKSLTNSLKSIHLSNPQQQTRSNNSKAANSLTNSLKNIHLSNPQTSTQSPPQTVHRVFEPSSKQLLFLETIANNNRHICRFKKSDKYFSLHKLSNVNYFFYHFVDEYSRIVAEHRSVWNEFSIPICTIVILQDNTKVFELQIEGSEIKYINGNVPDILNYINNDISCEVIFAKKPYSITNLNDILKLLSFVFIIKEHFNNLQDNEKRRILAAFSLWNIRD